MHRGAWWATVHGIAQSQTTDRLTLFPFKHDLVFHFLHILHSLQTLLLIFPLALPLPLL